MGWRTSPSAFATTIFGFRFLDNRFPISGELRLEKFLHSRSSWGLKSAIPIEIFHFFPYTVNTHIRYINLFIYMVKIEENFESSSFYTSTVGYRIASNRTGSNSLFRANSPKTEQSEHRKFRKGRTFRTPTVRTLVDPENL